MRRKLSKSAVSATRKMASSSGKSRRSRADRREDMRRRLIDATVELLVKKGYAGLRVAEVAARAKVSRGGQLHYFRTKDSLVLAALDEVYRASREASRARLDKIERPLQIRDIRNDAQEYYYAGNFLVVLDIVLSAGKTRKLGNSIRDIAHKYREPVEQMWADRLAAEGMPMAKALNIVWLVHSAVRGLTVRALLAHEKSRLEQVADLLDDLLQDELDRREHPAAARRTARSKAASLPGARGEATIA